MTLYLPTARDCMSTNVFRFSPDDDLFDAINGLLGRSYAAAPVVDGEERLLGMLTEKDCLRVHSTLTYDGDQVGTRVRDYMSPIRRTCEPRMDIFRVTEIFLETNFPLLPVVDGGRLVGVISRRDTLRGIKALRSQIAEAQRKFEAAAGRQADRPRSIEGLQRAFASQSTDQLVRLLKRG